MIIVIIILTKYFAIVIMKTVGVISGLIINKIIIIKIAGP